jgi:hypothetical protein
MGSRARGGPGGAPFPPSAKKAFPLTTSSFSLEFVQLIAGPLTIHRARPVLDLLTNTGRSIDEPATLRPGPIVRGRSALGSIREALLMRRSQPLRGIRAFSGTETASSTAVNFDPLCPIPPSCFSC